MNVQHENQSATEKQAWNLNGIIMLIVVILGIMLTSVIFFGGMNYGSAIKNPIILIASIIQFCIFTTIFSICFAGFKVLQPNEAYVFTLFGKYYGSLKKPGFYFVNPLVQAAIPKIENSKSNKSSFSLTSSGINIGIPHRQKVISLKVSTLDNNEQKINDADGNPIIIGIAVIWKVINPAKAVFNIDNYIEYLSIQCDSALRNIVRIYPYDTDDSSSEKSLRGSSIEIAQKLAEAIQEKMEIAGIEIVEARITKLSYAQEIAAAMLQRQQASAVIAARQLIVEGAVGMVEMALEKLKNMDIVNFDEERKAAMVSNLLVVLCGNREAQPIINSGTIY